MKLYGLFEDIMGASRDEKRREHAFEKASDKPVRRDPINEVAHELHPGPQKLKITKITDVSPTARTFRFEAVDGKLPPFQAGQYVSLQIPIGDEKVCRPYSISSAPYQARSGEHPFFEITIRKKGDTFVPEHAFDEWKAGTELIGNLPLGHFYYEPLRDSKNVVCLAGGSGITPFYSMIQEIAHGTLDVHLTLLYGSAKSDDIIFKDELDALEKQAPDKIRIVHVLSDEPNWPGEKGFLGKDLIEKYMGEDPTFFICGPQVMYTFVQKALAELKIKERRIRREVFGTPRDITKAEGYPLKKTEESQKDPADTVFQITIRRGIHEDTIEARATEPVAVALERAKIPFLTDCRSGECGFCRSKLVSGDIFVSPEGDGRRAEDKIFGWFHPCASYPLSDLVIKIPIY
jgi:ferredoxin-NADP reductase